MRFHSFLQALSLFTLFSEVLVTAQQYPITVLHEFPDPTWLDSNAVRHNGDVLITSATTNQIFLVRPRNPELVRTVARIPNANGANGIAELEKDVFYINGANFTAETGPVLGSYGVWKLDLRGTSPVISLVTMLPDVLLANGIARLHPTDDTYVLISDSWAGSIIRVNVKTGEYVTVIKMDMMLTQPGMDIGVSVLRTRGNYLYFNIWGVSLQRIPISTATGLATGPPENIVSLMAHSYILSRDGTKAWMSSNGLNALQEIDIVNKTSRIVVQNQADFITPTGAALGKKDGKDVVYIITGGAYNFVTGDSVSGGKLIRVDVE